MFLKTPYARVSASPSSFANASFLRRSWIAPFVIAWLTIFAAPSDLGDARLTSPRNPRETVQNQIPSDRHPGGDGGSSGSWPPLWRLGAASPARADDSAGAVPTASTTGAAIVAASVALQDIARVRNIYETASWRDDLAQNIASTYEAEARLWKTVKKKSDDPDPRTVGFQCEGQQLKEIDFGLIDQNGKIKNPMFRWKSAGSGSDAASAFGSGAGTGSGSRVGSDSAKGISSSAGGAVRIEGGSSDPDSLSACHSMLDSLDGQVIEACEGGAKHSKCVRARVDASGVCHPPQTSGDAPNMALCPELCSAGREASPFFTFPQVAQACCAQRGCAETVAARLKAAAQTSGVSAGPAAADQRKPSH